MFISQIIFLFLVLAICLLFHFVSFIWICLSVACMPDWASHTNQAQNNFRNRKKTVFLPKTSISFTVWHGSPMHCSVVHTRAHTFTHSLTSTSQKNLRVGFWSLRDWLGLWKLCEWAASIPLCVRMWFAFIVKNQMDFFVCHRHHYYRCIWNCSSGRREWKSHDTAHRSAERKKKEMIF